MTLHLSPTLHTPEVSLSVPHHRLVLRGACYPEDSIDFFRPIKEFLQTHTPQLTQVPLEVHAELSYINSSSQRELYHLLHEFLERGGSLRLVLYQGEEEEELEDLRHIVFGLENLKGVQVEYRAGYYGEEPLPAS